MEVAVKNSHNNRMKILTELEDRECVVRIGKGGRLYSAVKGKTVDFTSVPRIKHSRNNEKTHKKIEVKEKPETRQTIKAKENKQKLEDKDFLEDTKEFESLTHDEEDINEILKGTEDITQTDDSNDIFNLIDSMYDEEEDKK